MAGKKKLSQAATGNVVKNAFQEAVEKTEEVKGGFCVGKQAIKNSDRDKIEVADPTKLQGSLDIDTQVKRKYPNDPRWDYALAYDDKMYYMEVHPAETSEVDKMISKLKWLKNWLQTKAGKIDKLPKADQPFIWIPSGRYAILPTSREGRKLAASGLVTVKILKLK
ncbi:MAG: hypothetical protein K2K95_00860 [Muribaculaceae bacterium]|nr:hypothetical protein [Muribaculaceae bacterium]